MPDCEANSKMGLHIDHLFTLVGARERAAATLHRWGFDLSAAGIHAGRGTSNHLAVFPGPYWELLAVDAALPVNRHLRTLLASGAGLLGCALATADIDADSASLRRRGIEVAPAQEISRPIRVGDRQRVALFRVAQVQAPASFTGYFFFCQHLTPELVWPAPLPVHANGAIEMVGLHIVASDPQATAGHLAWLFGSHAAGSDGCVAHAGALALHCMNPVQFIRAHPDAAAWRFGAEARFAGIVLRVSGLAGCVRALGVEAPTADGGPELSACDPSLGQTMVTWRAC